MFVHYSKSHFTFLPLLALLILAVFTANATAAMVGKVTRIKGTAYQQFDDQLVKLKPGSVIESDIPLITGSDARLAIRFLDGSRLTLGEKATVVFKPLKLDPDNKGEETSQSVEIVTGTFRFISGLIGKKKPESVEIRTPVATIGVRGTEFFGGPLEAGMPPGQLHYGFMLMDGAIVVDNPNGSVTLTRPSEGTFLPMNGSKAPTKPAIWSQEAVDEAYASVSFE